MRILAIDQSCARAGAALLIDGKVVDERGWGATWTANQQLFELVPAMLAAAGLAVRDVDAFGVGLGPGSFAGIRIALSAARGFALPDGKQVVGVPSCEALAAEMLEEDGVLTAAVVGDARKGQAWVAVYGKGDGAPRVVRQCSLTPMTELAGALPADATIASPDWDRIGDLLVRACPGGARLLEGNRFPSASTLGRLVARRIGKGLASGPLVPMYMHPAAMPPPN